MTKSKVMSGFKGFDKDLKCRDFQFKVGKSFKEDEAVLCRKGFHFCEFPLDVFNYYPPSGSRFCDITGSDVLNQTESDSKRCAKRIKIKTEIGLKGLVDASIKFIYEKIDWVNAKESNTGDQSAATVNGDQSAATNTGYRSAATNTGDQSAATVNGDDSVACSIGYKGTASASLGSAIVLAERDDNYKLITIKSAIIDGVILKANVFYTLIDGEFVEV